MIFLAHAPQAQALAELLRPQAWLHSRDRHLGEGLDAAHRRARVTALLLGPECNDDPSLRALAALGAELRPKYLHTHTHPNPTGSPTRPGVPQRLAQEAA